MAELLIIPILIVIAIPSNFWMNRSRLKKSELVGPNSVLVLVKRTWGETVKNGLFDNPQIHLSHLAKPMQLDKHYSSIIPAETKITITDDDKQLSEKLVAIRPESGVLFLENTFQMQNTLWLTAIVVCFWIGLFGDDHISFIQENEGYLLAAVFVFYQIYYFKLYRANYILTPYQK